MTDPWLSAQQRADAQWVQLDRQLAAVVEAAIAETLAKLWRVVLGERVPLTSALTAAAQPPALDGAEQAARETWRQALNRWVRPVVYAHYTRQYSTAAQEPADAPVRAREQWWAETLDRVEETADRLVVAVRDTISDHPTESVDQLRDRVARVLGIDAPSKTLRDDIADVETRLAALSRLTTSQKSELYARRVRLQAELFRIQASASRSAAYTALAQVQPDDAEQFRDLARQSARSAGDLDKQRRELANIDEQLFKTKRDITPTEADQVAQLKRERQHLYGQVDEADETWRNSAERIARTESTNVLNEATLQRGQDAGDASGEELVKVWLSAKDARCRPTHGPPNGAHGQVVGIREKFRVGEALLERPGDPDGPLDEVINCRCTISILTRDEHTEIAAVLASAHASQEETVTTTAPELTGTDLDSLPPMMWHGVITVEGIYTGDGRKFNGNSIRTQALPMPIRFQREDWGGHTGAVVVANLEGARRFQQKIRAWGTFADGSLTPEVDEVQGLMATRMMRGISIDGDDVLDSQFSIETDAEGNLFEVYDSIRLRSSTLVPIPAFDEAEVFLGPPPADWLLEGEALVEQQNDPDTTPFAMEDLDALVADVSRIPEQLAEFWLPGGEGGAKIAWGTDGDFSRCRTNLSRYVSPGQVSGLCANLHHRALGVWPGQEAAGLTLTASVEGVAFTAADFEPWEGHESGPGADGATPITITDDGRVFGTVAAWNSCHTGFSDVCIPPPRSKTGYAYFHTGGVKLDDGTVLPIGKLTVSSRHANLKLGARSASAHYDDSSTAAAVVRAFENEVGIQVAGRIIPGTSDEKIAELLRSPMSGDWRPVPEGLEMIAAHGVNSPGFAVLRPMVATVGGRQTALISGALPVPFADRADQIAALVGLDIASKVEALAASIPLTPGEIQTRAAAMAASITPNEEA